MSQEAERETIFFFFSNYYSIPEDFHKHKEKSWEKEKKKAVEEPARLPVATELLFFFGCTAPLPMVGSPEDL